MTTQREAELEAEIVRLRSVMADVIKAHGYVGGTPIEVMSAPFISTALPDLVEKVEKMTIERCAQMFSVSGIGGEYLADQVRMISTGQIKLEELL